MKSKAMRVLSCFERQAISDLGTSTIDEKTGAIKDRQSFVWSGLVSSRLWVTCGHWSSASPSIQPAADWHCYGLALFDPAADARCRESLLLWAYTIPSTSRVSSSLSLKRNGPEHNGHPSCCPPEARVARLTQCTSEAGLEREWSAQPHPPS